MISKDMKMIMEENDQLTKENFNIAIVGLGYVGLPLAIEFSKKYKTIGFDINPARVNDLKKGSDVTNEISSVALLETRLEVTSEASSLVDCNIFIITVPTPVDLDKKPDFTHIINASKIVGKFIKNDSIIIYESTVYPGATEEICVPILEESSGLTFNKDFYCGYSPERINPGDKEHKITDILKITSGSTPKVAELVDSLYRSIIPAGTFKAANIKTAEAAKVIENTQRDLNIALINELSIIFKTLGLDTKEVLDAAETKWNFLPFRPGLVGGHCIGVDPYYLTYKSTLEGYTPEMILSGRRLNDRMSEIVASNLFELMEVKNINIANSRILILGFTFKEDCPDFRNTKVLDLYNYLKIKAKVVDIFDPWVDCELVKQELNIEVNDKLISDSYDAVILAVAHNQFEVFNSKGFGKIVKDNSVIYDLKHYLIDEIVTARL